MSSTNTGDMCSLAGASTYGVLMWGLPVTKKYDKLLHHLSTSRLWGWVKPINTELIYKDDGGVKKTTGEAIFIFEEHHDEENLANHTNGVRLDKNHTLGTRVIRVCNKCHSDIYGQTDGGASLHTASMVDPDSCKTCTPDQFCCCCKDVMSEEVGDIYSKYVSCQPCRENIEEQEKWRISIPILETESRFQETKYLCDEAILREKELMGDKAPVSEDWVSPFMISYCTDLLVDPTSEYYWPYGMSGRDYVRLQDVRRFNNPMNETPDSSWMDIEVTGEIIQDYWTRMKSLQDEFNFKSLKDPGSLPTTLSKKKESYRLFPDTHGFTCDDPTCQAMFHKQNELDGGSYAALILTGLPIYTSREGDLTCGSVSELGYGYEYCLACLMK